MLRRGAGYCVGEWEYWPWENPGDERVAEQGGSELQIPRGERGADSVRAHRFTRQLLQGANAGAPPAACSFPDEKFCVPCSPGAKVPIFSYRDACDVAHGSQGIQKLYRGKRGEFSVEWQAEQHIRPTQLSNELSFVARVGGDEQRLIIGTQQSQRVLPEGNNSSQSFRSVRALHHAHVPSMHAVEESNGPVNRLPEDADFIERMENLHGSGGGGNQLIHRDEASDHLLPRGRFQFWHGDGLSNIEMSGFNAA